MAADPIDIIRRSIGRPNLFGIPLLIVFLILFAAMIVAPLLEEEGTVLLDKGGRVGSREYDEELDQLGSPISRAAYVFGDIYCHQLTERSYQLNGNQMPVCSRDVGLFAGLLMGGIVGMFLSRRFPMTFLLIALAPMLLDGGTQALTSYESFNLLRVTTGLVAGIGLGIWTNKSTAETLKILFFHPDKREDQGPGT
ncbi:MAG: DUF2085 domain-containing protein [Thermoplasmata archaeon]|nr:DUF2085 domain-containing protein [Thermoplasmata archaeon]